MRVPFRERDPRTLAIWGTVALVIAVATSLLVPQLVFYGRTTTYAAEFVNTAGLTVGDPVSIAGVASGRVTSVELAGDRVRVEFRLDKSRHLGTASTAGVKVHTVLGKRYLDVKSRGEGELDPDQAIPLSRTEVPFTLDDLSRAADKTSEEIDLDALKRLMGTLVKDSPDPELSGRALDGITKATAVFNRHSGSFKAVLRGAQQVTGSVLEQTDTLVKLLNDTELIATTLAKRRDAIENLIADVASLSKRLSVLLDTNRPVIEPLLKRLDVITRSLQVSQRDFNAMVKQFAPLNRYMANISGQGPWGDTWAPAGIVPDNVLCAAGLVSGCS